jgi:hypothetical protein
MKFVCPNGHAVENVESDMPRCEPCKLVATWFNRRTGEVHTWQDETKYDRACRRLKDDMDAAFDNQYFGGGW